MDDLEGGGDRAGRAEGPEPGAQLVDEHADGEEVAAPVERPVAGGLLRREVVGRAEDHAGARARARPGGLEHLGDAEVEQAHRHDAARAVEGDEDVLGLEIAVDDADAVRRVERLEHGEGGGHDGVDLEAADAAQRRADRLAVEVLHHQVGPHLAHARLEDLDHVGVVDAVERLRLLEEALRDVGVLGQLGVEELDGHRPARLHVLRAEHVPHPAAADALGEAVFAVDEGAGAGRADGHRSRAGRGLETGVSS